MTKSNLRTKIFLFYASLILVILLLIGFLYITQIESELSNNIYTNLRGEALRAEIALHKFFESGYSDITTVSTNPIVVSGNTGQKLEILNIMKSALMADEFILIGTNRNVIASTAQGHEIEKYDEWIFEAMKGRTVVSDPLTIDNKPVISFLSPVLNVNNQIVAVLISQLSMDKVWELVDGLKSNSGFVFVEDSTGKIVAHPNKFYIHQSPYLYNEPVQNIVEFDDSTTMVAAYSALSRGKNYIMGEWKIYAAQPKSEAFFAVKSLFNNFILIIIMALIVALIVSYILAGIITRPVSHLLDGVRRIKTGEWDYKLSVRSNDEMEEIADSINELKGALKEKELQTRLKTDLQKKVKELEKMNKLMSEREAKIIQLEKELEKLKRRKK